MGEILRRPIRVPLNVALEVILKERIIAKQKPSTFKREFDKKEGWGAGHAPLLGGLNTTSKYWYENTCWCANGKCDRCPAKECADRDWRKRGKSV